MMSTAAMSHVLVFLTLLLVVIVPQAALSAPKVPCYFIFGDSLNDPGNNNDLKTGAKVNYLPYGVDFAGQRSTGRFTNNKTVVDMIAMSLGFSDFIPGIQSVTGSEILQGINYASGGGGILDESSKVSGEVLSLRMQMEYHKTTVRRLRTLLGSRHAAMNHLHKCLFTVGLGSNDYINNYFLHAEYQTSQKKYSPAEFAKLLVGEYSQALKYLHKNGARKVALFGVGLIGYTPLALGKFGANATKLNDAVELFNIELKSLVRELNTNFTDAKFTFLNTTGITFDPSVKPEQLKPCCQVANDFTCIPLTTNICPDREQSIFFDNTHPTEAANRPVAKRYYSAKYETDAYPCDIQHLVEHNSSTQAY